MRLGNQFSMIDFYGYQVLPLGSWRDERSLGLLKIYNVIKTVQS